MLKNFVDEFKENGCVLIPPSSEFGAFVDGLSKPIKEILPDYSEARRPNIEHTFHGLAISERLSGPDTMPEVIKHPELLYGKRIVIQGHNFPESIIPLLEHPDILSAVRSALGTDDIVLHNASISASYPGNTGNDNQYHSDTANFCNPKTAYKCHFEGRYIINVMILLNDVDESLAPMSILKGTHSVEQYIKMNSVVSKRLGLPENEDNITQPNWPYKELLDDFDFEEFLVKGEKGSFSLMNSSCLHRATENKSTHGVRRVAIFNYGRASDKCFRRYYPYRQSKEFLSQLHDKSLGKNTYKKSANILPHVQKRIEQYGKSFYSFLSRQINRILHPKFVLAKLRLKLENIFFRFNKSKREYINIGGGPVFSHPKFFTLDVEIQNNADEGKVCFDLVEDLPFPFADGEIKGLYTSHCLEHLTEKQGIEILKEAYRVMQPGGIFRIVLPDIGRMFDAYDARDSSFFSSFRVSAKSHQVWYLDSWLRLVTRLFAGHVVDMFSDDELYKLYNEKERMEYVDEVLSAGEKVSKVRYLPGVHKSYWSAEKMMSKLENIGFKHVTEVDRGKTSDPTFQNSAIFDNTQPNYSFYVEASK